MATTTAAPVSVEEYLNSSYEPDMEYIDGQLEERNVGEIEQSDVMAGIMACLQRRAKEWSIRVRPDVRTQVGPTRYRVPDIVICSRSSQDKRIVREPPLAVIEVLSPEDRISRYHQRIADYRMTLRLASSAHSGLISSPAQSVRKIESDLSNVNVSTTEQMDAFQAKLLELETRIINLEDPKDRPAA